RYAQAEEARVAQLGVVLVRKARFAIVAGRPLGELRSERLGLRDQLRLLRRKRVARADDRIARIGHSPREERKSCSTELNASGWSIGPRWPQPASMTYCEP